MKLFSSVLFLSTIILASAILIAPMLQAQEGDTFLPSVGNTTQTAQQATQNGPPEQIPPGVQVEVIAPLPLPVAVEGGAVSVSGAVDANVSGSVDVNNFPATQEVNVTNGQDAPIPVSVQESTKEIVWAQERLIDANEIKSVSWRKLDGAIFQLVPSGYDLVITDILVSTDAVYGDPSNPYDVAFWLQDGQGGSSRLFDIAGSSLPFSHSFTTPFVISEDLGLGLSASNLVQPDLTNFNKVLLTGYLAPVSQ